MADTKLDTPSSATGVGIDPPNGLGRFTQLANALGKQDRAWKRRKSAGWSILSPAAIRLIVDRKINSVLEVCAGSGHNAALLQTAGVKVVATDLKPLSKDKTTYQREWDNLPSSKNVVQQDAVEAVRQYCGASEEGSKNPTLMLCYPDRQSDLARRVLDAYTGETILYVGEGRGGSSATDEFFDALDTSFDLVAYVPTEIVNEDARDCLWILDRHHRSSTDNADHGSKPFGRTIPHMVVSHKSQVLDSHAQMTEAEFAEQESEARLLFEMDNPGDGCVIS